MTIDSASGAPVGGQGMRRIGFMMSGSAALWPRRPRAALAGCEHHGAFRSDAPAVLRPRVRRAEAAICGILARPFEHPIAILRRREERLDERAPFQITPEIHDEYAVVGMIRREVAKREGSGREDTPVHLRQRKCRRTGAQSKQIAVQ